jgi:hypothetical protein
MELNDEEQQLMLSKFIGASLDTDIKYISSCFIRRKIVLKGDQVTTNILLIVSKEKLYGFSKSMDQIKFEFPFDKIRNLEIESFNPKSVLIELKDFKLNNNSIPLIVIYIENRETFLNYLQCYYSTYFAEVHGKVKELKIKKVEYFTYDSKKNVPKKISLILHDLPEEYYLFDYFTYK